MDNYGEQVKKIIDVAGREYGYVPAHNEKTPRPT